MGGGWVEEALGQGGVEQLPTKSGRLAGGRGVDAKLNDLCSEEGVLFLQHSNLVLEEREGIGRLLGQLGSSCQLLVLRNEIFQVLHCLVQYCALTVYILCLCVCVCV